MNIYKSVNNHKNYFNFYLELKIRIDLLEFKTNSLKVFSYKKI